MRSSSMKREIPAVPAPSVSYRQAQQHLFAAQGIRPARAVPSVGAGNARQAAGFGFELVITHDARGMHECTSDAHGYKARRPPFSAVVERPVAKAAMTRCRGLISEVHNWRAGSYKRGFMQKVMAEAGGCCDGDAVIFAERGLSVGRTDLAFESAIGKGSYGIVEKCRRPNGQLVAVKVAGKEQRDVALTTQRIEMAVYLRLPQHDNVVSCLAMNDTKAGMPIALEFCDGGDLFGVAENRPAMTATDKLGLLSDAAAGLQHVHDHGFVHADIKPENILLKKLPEGGFKAKVTDFGLALVDGETRNGQGTTGYIPPEAMYDMVPAKANQDTFAMGHTALVLLSKTQYRRSNMFCCDAVTSPEEKALCATLQDTAKEQFESIRKLVVHRTVTSGILKARLLCEEMFEPPLAKHPKFLSGLALMLSADPSRRPNMLEAKRFFAEIRRDLLGGVTASSGRHGGGSAAQTPCVGGVAAGGVAAETSRDTGGCAVPRTRQEAWGPEPAIFSPTTYTMGRSSHCGRGYGEYATGYDRSQQYDGVTASRGSHGGGSAAQTPCVGGVPAGGVAAGGVAAGFSRDTGGCAVLHTQQKTWEFATGYDRYEQFGGAAVSSGSHGGGSAAKTPCLGGVPAGGFAAPMLRDAGGRALPRTQQAAMAVEPDLTQTGFTRVDGQSTAVQGGAWGGGANHGGAGMVGGYVGGTGGIDRTHGRDAQGYAAPAPHPAVQAGGAPYRPAVGQCGSFSKPTAGQGVFALLVNGFGASGMSPRVAGWQGISPRPVQPRSACKTPAAVAMPRHAIETSPRGAIGRGTEARFGVTAAAATDSGPWPISRLPVTKLRAVVGGSPVHRAPAREQWRYGGGYAGAYGGGTGEEYAGYWASGVVGSVVPPSGAKIWEGRARAPRPKNGTYRGTRWNRAVGRKVARALGGGVASGVAAAEVGEVCVAPPRDRSRRHFMRSSARAE